MGPIKKGGRGLVLFFVRTYTRIRIRDSMYPQFEYKTTESDPPLVSLPALNNVV